MQFLEALHLLKLYFWYNGRVLELFINLLLIFVMQEFIKPL